jgi:hypothetical protein
MSNRESLIRRLEKQAAHDAVHFSPPFQPVSEFIESENTTVECTYIPHDWQLNSMPAATSKQTLPAKPKSKLVLRKRKPVASEGGSADKQDTSARGVSSPEPVPSTSIDPIARLREWVTKAKYGDSDAVESIRRELDNNPALWQAVGDLAANAEALLISVIADGNVLVSQSMEREAERLRFELAEGNTPSPLERLAIQRVVACWLHTQYADRATIAADAAGTKITAWGKRQEAAERRLQSAFRSLGLVRRLVHRRGQAKPTASTSAPRAEVLTPNNLPNQPIVNGAVVQPSTPHNRIRKFIRREEAVT